MRKILMITLFAFVSLSAQETTTTSKTDSYNWYFYLGGGGGKADSFGISAKTTSGQVGFEYRLNPYIGFGLGGGMNNWAVKTETDRQGIFLAFIASDRSSVSSNLPVYFLITPTRYEVKYNHYSANFNYHINGDKTFDPYIGIGVIGGSCTGSIGGCTVLGAEGRLGLQINFTRFFVYLQGQGQSLNFKQDGNPLVSNATNFTGTFGLGVRF